MRIKCSAHCNIRYQFHLISNDIQCKRKKLPRLSKSSNNRTQKWKVTEERFMRGHEGKCVIQRIVCIGSELPEKAIEADTIYTWIGRI